jgi:hypothetical protein
MEPFMQRAESRLAQTVSTLLEHAGPLHLDGQPLRAAIALRFDGLCIGALDRRLACAERELARLHGFETARLLRQAAALWNASSHAGGTSVANRSSNTSGTSVANRPDDASGALRLATLRMALREELHCQVADRVRATPRLQLMIARCSSLEPASWDGAELALAALALRNDSAARARLGEVLQACAGRPALMGFNTEAESSTWAAAMLRALAPYRCRASVDPRTVRVANR